MNLDEGQKKKVAGWIEEGLKLSDIQNKLASEFGLRATYMEMRFLLADLGLQPKDKPAATAPADIGKVPPPAAPSIAPGPLADADDLAGGTVAVSVDQVTRPGALASGNVKFTDGKSADWYLDQMGRLGLVPKEQGYKPSEEDLMDFQAELQQQLAKLGY
jgi:hypothetical protein